MGMREMLNQLQPLQDMTGLNSCPDHRDGRFSGASRRSIYWPCITGGSRGRPSLVEEGDIIKDQYSGTGSWNWMYPMKNWQQEKAKWQPREPKVKTGYLARYASMVTSRKPWVQFWKYRKQNKESTRRKAPCS